MGNDRNLNKKTFGLLSVINKGRTDILNIDPYHDCFKMKETQNLKQIGLTKKTKVC